MPRQFIVPDLHGYAYSFEALIDKIGLEPTDHLVLLGDYIDRGPASRQLIDRLMELGQQGYHLTPLRGNHEEMLLQNLNESHNLGLELPSRARPFLDTEGRFEARYLAFFQSLAYYHQQPDALFAHACPNLRLADPLSDTEHLLWARRSSPIPRGFHKQVVHGHIPTPLHQIQQAVDTRQQILSIDNGIYRHEPGYGQLVCLQWPERILWVVPGALAR